jgi:two-component system copper resistance phosphate regulon response regulator CusR
VRILIAEDEAKTRRYVAQGLRELGFAVEAVEHCNEALSLLREHAFDAAVLSVMLPGLDGWALVRTLRAENNRTPILFLTARDHVEDRVRGFELGANDYLVKPVQAHQVVEAVRRLLGAA